MKAGKIHPIKIALWCILAIFLVLIGIVLGSLLVQKYVKKVSVPVFAGYASMIVATGSMNGTIDQGDMIVIRKTGDYRLGDIVTFLEADSSVPVTHRLISYGPEEGTFITKGDANNTADIIPLSDEQIVGEVVMTIPKVGLFIEWFSRKGGIFYFLAIFAVLTVGVYFWNRLKPEPETDSDLSEVAVKNNEEV